MERRRYEALAQTALADGGLAFDLHNCGAGHAGSDPDSRDRAEVVRYWKSQLLERTSRARCYVRQGTSLVEFTDDRADERPDEKAARIERARSFLERSQRERAAAAGEAVYRVVHAPRVAVRAAPSRSARVRGVKSAGDEVVVSEARGGWVRLSVRDDWWAIELAAGRAAADDGGEAEGCTLGASGAEAWMLVHGAEVGLGELLRREIAAAP